MFCGRTKNCFGESGIFLVFFPFDVYLFQLVAFSAPLMSCCYYFCTSHTHLSRLPLRWLRFFPVIYLFLLASLERTLYTWLSAYLFCAPGLYLFFSLPSNMLLVDTLFSFSLHPFCHCCFFFTSWGLIFGLRVSGFVCFTPIIIWLTLNLSNNTDNGTENFDLVSYSSPLVVDSSKRSSAFFIWVRYTFNPSQNYLHIPIGDSWIRCFAYFDDGFNWRTLSSPNNRFL